jgi:hypothetical protein
MVATKYIHIYIYNIQIRATGAQTYTQAETLINKTTLHADRRNNNVDGGK